MSKEVDGLRYYGIVEMFDLIEVASEEDKILLENIDDEDIDDIINIVLDNSEFRMSPTFSAMAIDKAVTVFLNEDCPEEEKDEDAYDRDEFIERLFKELRKN